MVCRHARVVLELDEQRALLAEVQRAQIHRQRALAPQTHVRTTPKRSLPGTKRPKPEAIRDQFLCGNDGAGWVQGRWVRASGEATWYPMMRLILAPPWGSMYTLAWTPNEVERFAIQCTITVPTKPESGMNENEPLPSFEIDSSSGTSRSYPNLRKRRARNPRFGQSQACAVSRMQIKDDACPARGAIEGSSHGKRKMSASEERGARERDQRREYPKVWITGCTPWARCSLFSRLGVIPRGGIRCSLIPRISSSVPCIARDVAHLGVFHVGG